MVADVPGPASLVDETVQLSPGASGHLLEESPHHPPGGLSVGSGTRIGQVSGESRRREVRTLSANPIARCPSRRRAPARACESVRVRSVTIVLQGSRRPRGQASRWTELGAGSLSPLRIDSIMLTPVATRRPSAAPDQPTRDPWFADEGQPSKDAGYLTAPRSCQVGACQLRLGRGAGIPRFGRSLLAHHGLPLAVPHGACYGSADLEATRRAPLGVDEVEVPVRPTRSFPVGNHPSPAERIDADHISPMTHDGACYCFRTGTAGPGVLGLDNRCIPMSDKKGRL